VSHLWKSLLAIATVVSLFTFTGCSGNQNAPGIPQTDFSFTLAPESVSLVSGSPGQTLTLKSAASGGFNRPIAVTISGLPAGVNATPASFSLTPGTAQPVILTAASSAPGAAGVMLTLTGTAGSLSHAVTTSLTVFDPNVQPPSTQQPGFSLALSPASLTLQDGAATQTAAITETALNGFNSSVAVQFISLPPGVTATPSTLTLTPGVAQNITFSAVNATAGPANITIGGVSGSLTQYVNLPLTITAAAGASTGDFSLSTNPMLLTLQDGAASTLAVTANALNGFSGSVAVQISGLPSGVTATPSMLTLTAGTPQNVSFTATNASAGSTEIEIQGTSGALSHSLDLLTNITSGPGFSLSVAPMAQTVTIGNATGATVAVTAAALNGFSGQVSVTLSGLPTGVTANPTTLTLSPGTAQNITLTAGQTAIVGTSTLTFNGADGSITGSTTLPLTVQASPVPDVVTYHYDNARDGLNAQETILTPATVNALTFGKTGFYATDGKVDAAPLFAAQVSTGPGTTTNVVYVATEHDSVYAFNTANGQQLWKTSVLGANEHTATNGCPQISPEVGITSTPVIDRTAGPNGTIFVIGMSQESGGAYHQRLHALDLATGAEQSGSPSEITASYPGTGDNSSNGNVVFDPAQYAERVGLLLLNGTIYTGWTSHCDYRPYTGWVMGFSESTLQQTQVLNLTPNGSEGAIWMSGNGLAADNAGNIYLLDANGSFQDTFNAFGFPSDGDYGNGIVKLSTSNILSVSDFFEVYNSGSESNSDVDIGSGGTMLLPDQVDASGNTRHLLVGAGKDTNIYVADRDNLGKFNLATQDNHNVYQEVPGALAQGAWSSPAYFNQTVYYAGQGDVLKAFPINNALLATTPSSKSTTTFAYPGSTPSISANGTSNGIVWALEDNQGSAAVLHAYDAANLSNELYNSNQALPGGGSSSFGNGNKFITPVVVNGNVYVGTPSGVAVFGLLPVN
jgi:hypothetical protein